MINFYEQWLRTNNKHTALKLAQDEERSITIQRYGADVRFYWAGFILMGPPSEGIE